MSETIFEIFKIIDLGLWVYDIIAEVLHGLNFSLDLRLLCNIARCLNGLDSGLQFWSYDIIVEVLDGLNFNLHLQLCSTIAGCLIGINFRLQLRVVKPSGTREGSTLARNSVCATPSVII